MCSISGTAMGEGIREARMFAIKNGVDVLLEDYLKTVKK